MENFTPKESYDASLIIRQFLLTTPHHSQKPDERSLTARLCGESLELFREILKASTSEHCSTASSNLVSLERSFGRLKLWSDGYGIAAGRLDDVFARSQVIRSATQNLLGSLATTLTDRLVLRLKNSTELTNEPLNTLILEVRSLVESIGVDEEEESLSDESSDFESDSIEEIVQDLLTDTLCLVELDPLLKSPVFDARDDKERVAAHDDTINWAPHQIYCERVESRFPQAINPLIFRLGKANYERYIRCQEERESHTDGRANDAESALLLLARASTVDGSNFHDSALGSSLPSASSYAETIMSYGGNEGRSVRIPPLPLQGKAGKPFLCVACGRSVLISNNSAWKRHLYADLCPWLCLDTSCSYGDKVYKSKSDWVSHLALGHHLEPKWGSMECPLCLKDTGAGKTAIVKHLSSHLEEISLGALPSGLKFDSESEDESQDTKDTHLDSLSTRKRSLNMDTANVPTGSDIFLPRFLPREDKVPDEESLVEDTENDIAPPAPPANIRVSDPDPKENIEAYRSQHHTPQVWESHREEITRLYLDEDRPLTEVMDMMCQRGFRATVSTYRSYFRKWRFRKYNNSELEYIRTLQIETQLIALKKRTTFQEEKDDADQSNDGHSTTGTHNEHGGLRPTKPSPDIIRRPGLRPRPIGGMQNRPISNIPDQGQISRGSFVPSETSSYHKTPMLDQTNRQRASVRQGNEPRETHPNVSAFEAPTATSNTTEVATEKPNTKRIAQKVTSRTETDAEQSKRDASAYIDCVKSLDSFQDIFKATLSERFDYNYNEAMHRASELFHGHTDLIDGRNSFLPPELKNLRTEEEGKFVATPTRGADLPSADAVDKHSSL